MSFEQIARQQQAREQINKQTQTVYEDYKKIKGFKDVGYLLEDYVVSGGEVTKDPIRNDTVHVSDIVASLNDNMMSREGHSFKVDVPNTTYYLDFNKDGDWHWGLSHEGVVNEDYLAIASVTTNASGLVQTITDLRGHVGGTRFKDDFGLEQYAKQDYVNAQLADKVNKDELQSISSGVAGIFATIEELESTYPTGDDKMYVVTGDVKEVATLQITSGATSSGDVTVTLDGISKSISVFGGVAEVASLTINAAPTIAGNVTVTLNNVPTAIPINPATETTAEAVANKIRSTIFDGWTTSGSGATVIFTATTVGGKTNAGYNAGGTGATGVMTTTTEGLAADNAASVANKIRSTTFDGWTTSGSGATVVFTKNTSGTNIPPDYSPGMTGAAGTITVTTTGYPADGNWYYWNGAAWTAGGVFLESQSSIFKNLLTNSNVPASFESDIANGVIHIWPDGRWAKFGNFWDGYKIISAQQHHKYFFKVALKPESTTHFRADSFGLIYSDNSRTYASGVRNKTQVYGIVTAEKTMQANAVFLTAGIGTLVRDYELVMDLTEIYGAGNEPSAEEFNKILSYFGGWVDSAVSNNYVQKSLMRSLSDVQMDLAKQRELATLPSSILKTFEINKYMTLIWYDTDRKIIYAHDGDLTKLYASYDLAQTWHLVFTYSSAIRRFYTLKSGYHLIIANDKKISRIAPDFSSFTTFNGLNVEPCLYSSLGFADDGDGTIMYAEYGTYEQDTRVLRSTNDGLTWTVSEDGTDVRHWHSVQVDPYTGHFWACGGDTGHECRIIKSKDKGDTWQIMTSGEQSDRAVGLAFFEDFVVWGMDTAGVKPYVMRADKNNFIPEQIDEAPYGATVLGIAMTIDGYAFGWSRIETNSAQRNYSVLWVTDGYTIKEIQRFAMRPEIVTGTGSYGFFVASLIDSENRWFAQPTGTSIDGLVGFSLPLIS